MSYKLGNKEYKSQYYLSHRDEIIARSRKYRQKNAELQFKEEKQIT